MQIFIAYISLIFSLFIIDALWLSTMMNIIYKPNIGHLLTENVDYIAATFFYLIYSGGVLFFVVNPALKQGASLKEVFIHGAILGILCYGTYDLTNQATLKDWPYTVTMIDIVWGAIITGTICIIATSIAKNF